MIDITESLIELTREVSDFQERVYVAYPLKVQDQEPFAVISPMSHTPVLISEGEEIIADLAYSLDLYTSSPGACRHLVQELSKLLTPMLIQVTGESLGFDPYYELYSTNLSLNVRVDKRGVTYTS